MTRHIAKTKQSILIDVRPVFLLMMMGNTFWNDRRDDVRIALGHRADVEPHNLRE